SVTTTKLAFGSVGAEQLADGSVTSAKLALGSVGTEQIVPGSITADLLAPGLLLSNVEGSAVNQVDQVADGSITGRHIQEQSIGLSALQFAPVITNASQGIVKQQFGLAPYSFAAQAEQVELIIPFDEPFVDNYYVLTVTTDNPACYAVVHSKAAAHAVILIIRTRISQEPIGHLNWIAIGKG
ncbi:WIAG-tail domain, partial [Paenibacillus sp. NRS-1760]|uniref:WIAG-tail domain n=1 Tax=Paenibacillus sp. NRS-1760 TaxID=3233902 RepID=UPI003D2B03B2